MTIFLAARKWFSRHQMTKRHFMELLDDNLKLVKPSNSGLWLKLFDHSNLLCTKATRVIVNYASICEHKLKFFP